MFSGGIRRGGFIGDPEWLDFGCDYIQLIRKLVTKIAVFKKIIPLLITVKDAVSPPAAVADRAFPQKRSPNTPLESLPLAMRRKPFVLGQLGKAVPAPTALPEPVPVEGPLNQNDLPPFAGVQGVKDNWLALCN